MAAIVEDGEEPRSGEYPKTGFLLHDLFVKSIPLS
jgi:hypothetical protein